MTYRLIRIASALALAGLLAGCGTHSSISSYFFSDKAILCPDAAVLANTASLPAFSPAAEDDPSGVVYKIAMTNVVTRCSYDKRERTADTWLKISFQAQRPPGDGETGYRVPYYVALTSGGEIVDKKIYWLDFKFSGRNASARGETVIDSTIVKYEKGKTAYDYHLLVGFQLTKAQLDYNAKMGRYEP
ncbi:MAG TPA: hypothetical protein VGC27_04620 [Rhizomicrobium sp.]